MVIRSGAIPSTWAAAFCAMAGTWVPHQISADPSGLTWTTAAWGSIGACERNGWR